MFPRRFFRINYVTKAKVTLSDACFEAMTDNLSAGGIFLHTDYALPVGTFATINFTIPNASHPSVTVKGAVIRKEQQGLAFEFKSVDYYTFTNLKAFIRQKPLPYW